MIKQITCSLIFIFFMFIPYTVHAINFNFNDGLSQIIDYQLYHQYVPAEHVYMSVQNEGLSPSDGWALGNIDAPTSVEIADGALIGGSATQSAANVSTYGSSFLEITGGTVGGYVDYRYNSSGVMTGGNILNSLRLYNTAELSLYGGSISRNLEVFWGSELTMFGGTVAGGLNVIEIGEATISGGNIGGNLQVIQSGMAVWSGGTVGDTLLTHHGGTLEIIGTDFTINGNSVSYGEQFFLPSSLYGNISGTLASGEAFSNVYNLGSWSDHGTIILTEYIGTNPVPEPATMLLFGTGLLGLAGARRKFKK